VLGSGLIRDHQVRLPNARFLAVRGELTRDRLGLDESMPLGDPGLLAEKLLTQPVAKRYRLGVIPHYADKQDARVLALLQQQGGAACLIDPEAYPAVVIQQIAACEQVVSSSLHGIIVAHALGIPAVWVQLSESVAGGGFKFHDYASSVRAELSPVELKPEMTLTDLELLASLPDPALLRQRRDELDRLFTSLLSGAE
jgi:pyruvyltransferase